MISPDDSHNSHPDMRSDKPGRIPESLIDAAIDGELNEDIQREIAEALRYDPARKQELVDTSNAIHALQMPISTPDFTDSVLARADRHRRFIPAAWRKHVRAGRLGVAAALLMTLMVVAGLQRVYPRLTTFGAHPTPVFHIEQAMDQGASELACQVNDELEVIRASVNPVIELFAVPGRNDQRFGVEVSIDASLGNTSLMNATVTNVTMITRMAHSGEEEHEQSSRIRGVSGVCSVSSSAVGARFHSIDDELDGSSFKASRSEPVDVAALP